MPNFDTTVDDVRAALHELVHEFENGRQIPYGQHVVTDNGNGAWASVGTSDYFNCGVNKHTHVAPAVGSYGRITDQDKATLEQWFTRQFEGTYLAAALGARPAVQGATWNFTLVRGGTNTALNFHLGRQ
jgi:hypothetical protein